MHKKETSFEQDKEALLYEYENVKRLIRKKKMERVLKWVCGIIVSIFVIYIASVIWRKVTVYPIMDSEITMKEDGMQFTYNRQIENELHEPRTRLVNAGISYVSYPLFFKTGEYRIDWTRVKTLGFSKTAYDAGYYTYMAEQYTGVFKKNTWSGPGALYEEGDTYRYKSSVEQMMMYPLQKDWDIASLDKVADHSQIGAYVRLKKKLPLQDILNLDTRMKKKKIDIGLSWVGVAYDDGDTPDVEYHSNGHGDPTYAKQYLGVVGFDIYQKDRTTPIFDFSEFKYPLLDFQDEKIEGFTHPITEYGKVSVKEYETHMMSMLQYIYDQPKYREFLGDDNEQDYSFYPDIIKDIKKNGIQSDVIYVTTTKEQFKELMLQDEVASAFITDKE